MSIVIRKRGVVEQSFPRKAEFIQHVQDCLAKARSLFTGFDLENYEIPIVFKRNGCAAGTARCRGGVYNLEFSIEAIGLDWDQMVNETIPHEVAHIVDHVLNRRFDHGIIWAMYCRKLGGNPSRTHNMAVTKARKVSKVKYTATCGTVLWLTVAMHNKVQRGQVRVLRSTGGKIVAECCNWEKMAV